MPLLRVPAYARPRIGVSPLAGCCRVSVRHRRTPAPVAEPLAPANAPSAAAGEPPRVVIRPFMTKLGAASVVDESHHIIHRPLVLQTPPPTRSVKGTVTARDESEPNVMAAVRAHTVQRIWQLNCSTLRDPSAGVRGGGMGLLREQHRLEQRSSADRSNIPGSVAPTAR